LVRLVVFGESQNEEGTPVQVRDSTSCCEACTGFEQGATVGADQRPNGKAFGKGQVRRPAAMARIPGFLDQKPRITEALPRQGWGRGLSWFFGSPN